MVISKNAPSSFEERERRLASAGRTGGLPSTTIISKDAPSSFEERERRLASAGRTGGSTSKRGSNKGEGLKDVSRTPKEQVVKIEKAPIEEQPTIKTIDRKELIEEAPIDPVGIALQTKKREALRKSIKSGEQRSTRIPYTLSKSIQEQTKKQPSMISAAPTGIESVKQKAKLKIAAAGRALKSGFTLSPTAEGKGVNFFLSEQSTGLETLAFTAGTAGLIASFGTVPSKIVGGAVALNTKALALAGTKALPKVGRTVATFGVIGTRTAALGAAAFKGTQAVESVLRTPQQKIIARDPEFQRAAKAARVAETESFKDAPLFKKLKFEVTTLLGDKKEFNAAFTQEFKGEKPKEALALAQRARTGAGVGEAAAIFVESASIERGGRLLLKGFKPTAKGAFGVAFRNIAGLGAIEGGTTSFTSDIARGRSFNLAKAGISAGIGAGTAGTIGGFIATAGRTPAGKALQTVSYLTDADEFVGDKLADATGFFLGESTKKAPVFTFTNVLTNVPTDTPTKAAIFTPTDAQVRVLTPTSVFVDTFTGVGEQSKTAPAFSESELTPSFSTDTSTDIPIDTSTDVSTDIPTDTFVFVDVPTNTNTNVPTNVPTDVPVNVPVNVPTNVPTNVNVPVFVPTNPLAFGSLLGRGAFGSSKKKKKKKKGQQFSFTPSLTAIAFGIKGTTKQKIFSGFETRPIQNKKKKGVFSL